MSMFQTFHNANDQFLNYLLQDTPRIAVRSIPSYPQLITGNHVSANTHTQRLKMNSLPDINSFCPTCTIEVSTCLQVFYERMRTSKHCQVFGYQNQNYVGLRDALTTTLSNYLAAATLMIASIHDAVATADEQRGGSNSFPRGRNS